MNAILPTEVMRKYIEYARRYCNPRLTKAAAKVNGIRIISHSYTCLETSLYFLSCPHITFLSFRTIPFAALSLFLNHSIPFPPYTFLSFPKYIATKLAITSMLKISQLNFLQSRLIQSLRTVMDIVRYTYSL